jgi:hypothetical protein
MSLEIVGIKEEQIATRATWKAAAGEAASFNIRSYFKWLTW